MSYLLKSCDILGYVIFVDYGKTYHVLCNDCYEGSIQEIANTENVTYESPIYVDAEGEIECKQCNKTIKMEND